jgi:uncharacterized membrane protein
MTLAHGFLVLHALTAAFGLAGMLIAIPRPELWASSATAGRVFALGMQHGGAVQIALGAAAMLAYGIATLGGRRTVVFLVASGGVSLAMELIGTTTGWPFGPYGYGETLGPKVLGRVPIAIPLSWFTVGLASYLLGRVVLQRHARRRRTAWSIVLGVWFLTVWDLVLDPAMSHAAVPVRFWTWEASGAYLGMPLRNLAGWAITGAAFLALARLGWGGDDVDVARLPVAFPAAVYAVNVGFAMALAAAAGLWTPILLAGTLALVPWLVPRRRDRALHVAPA